MYLHNNQRVSSENLHFGVWVEPFDDRTGRNSLLTRRIVPCRNSSPSREPSERVSRSSCLEIHDRQERSDWGWMAHGNHFERQPF